MHGAINCALKKGMGREMVPKKDTAPADQPGSKAFENTATRVKTVRFKKTFSNTTI